MTPQLALRVAIVGTLALALFAIIFFRLWFLQVLSGGQYVAAGAGQHSASIAIPPPRGEILDRNGNVLVDSVQASRGPDRAARPAGPAQPGKPRSRRRPPTS